MELEDFKKKHMFTKNIKKGDIFTFGSKFNNTGQSYQLVVTADATADDPISRLKEMEAIYSIESVGRQVEQIKILCQGIFEKISSMEQRPQTCEKWKHKDKKSWTKERYEQYHAEYRERNRERLREYARSYKKRLKEQKNAVGS